MRILTLLAASSLALGLVATLPLAAAAPAPAPSAPSAQPAAAPESPAPADLSDLFTPKPQLRSPLPIPGPCHAQITCLSGFTASCDGQTVCAWKPDVRTNPGYVRCDGVQTTCP